MERAEWVVIPAKAQEIRGEKTKGGGPAYLGLGASASASAWAWAWARSVHLEEKGPPKKERP